MKEVDITCSGIRGHCGPIKHAHKILAVELVRFVDKNERHPEHNTILPCVILEVLEFGANTLKLPFPKVNVCSFYFDDLAPELQKAVEEFMYTANEKDDALVPGDDKCLNM